MNQITVIHNISVQSGSELKVQTHIQKCFKLQCSYYLDGVLIISNKHRTVAFLMELLQRFIRM